MRFSPFLTRRQPIDHKEIEHPKKRLRRSNSQTINLLSYFYVYYVYSVEFWPNRVVAECNSVFFVSRFRGREQKKKKQA